MDRPLWTDGPARRLRPAQPPLRGAVRPRLHDARQARGDAAQPRIAQRKRLREAARADHHRRLHELAHDRRSDSAPGLRDAGRWRGRPDDDESQARQAKGLSKIIVPIGYAERTNFKGGENLVDVTRSGHEICGKKALAQAGMSIKEVASFHPYDDFIIAIMLQFEAFGFCKPGEGVAFIRDHDFSYNGDLPINTGGGQISAGQAACSSHNLVEAVRQLQGEAGKRQVKDTRNALVTGIGWINYGRNWGSSAALVLVPE